MSDETPKKPSDRIVARAQAITLEWVAAGIEDSGHLRLTATSAALLEAIDSEAERRTAWETKVEAGLRALAVYSLHFHVESVSAEGHWARQAVEALSKVKP